MKKSNIKRLREEIKLTQEQFAKEIGVCKISVSYYESGKVTPSAPVMSRIIKVAKRYRVTITLDELLGK